MQAKLLTLRKLSDSRFKNSIFPIFKSRPLSFYSFSTIPPENPSPPPNQSTPQNPPKTFLTSKFFQRYFGPQSYTASPKSKNRWLMVIPCFLSNLCIGSPYAWSMVSGFEFFIFHKFITTTFHRIVG